MELSRHFDFAGRNLWELAGIVAIIVVFLVFGWLNLAAITNMDLSSQLAHTRMWLLFAVILLIALSLLLVGTGWSVALARLGGVWGGLIVLIAFTIAMATGAAGLRQPLTADLWPPEPRTGSVDLLLKVATQISDLNRGDSGQLPITFLTIDSPALNWAFRDWQIQNVSELAQNTTPELMITPPWNVSLSVNYRGETLVLREVADWDHATPANWLSWFIYRQMPMLQDNVVLWVRSDLMLDSQGLPATAP